MHRILLFSTLMLVGGLLANPVAAQEAAEASSEDMTIGSMAPPIDIEHWVSTGDGKFEAFNEFEPGKVYVVEFWATWCGPCIASMPHLAELQQHYADRGVTVVSVSDEPLETVEKFLERDVMQSRQSAEAEGEEDAPKTYGELTSVYCLTTDPDSSVKNDYFRAAGQTGIPCAFIVGKDGVVEWIGHPMGMDEPLEQVVTDSWDREAFGKAFRAQQQLDKAFRAAIIAARQGDYDTYDAKVEEIKGLDLPEDMQARLPMLFNQLEHQRLLSMLSNDPEGAIASLEEKSSEMKLAQVAAIGATIAQQSQRGASFKPELVDAVTALIEEKAADEEAAGTVYNALAGLYQARGDLDKAIEMQEKAIDNPPSNLPAASAARFEAMMKAYLKKLQDEKAATQQNDAADAPSAG
ncbi:redoxin domain-containing protein [Aeoliella sp. ICT_H6.2]|uniref:Redoxin domain-containing protein n=1 Tax=Aeoliella straminimaris TaxID=2954799 RepID=A0A9X2F563_9BACT|nr:redoxin domain-containing protein [Aeoliella straminimaris]